MSLNAQAQQVKFEQEAFDYFFTNIFKLEYQKVKAIQFRKYTERTLTEFDLFDNCFQGEDQVRKGLYDNAHGKSISEKIIDVERVDYVSFKDRKVKSKIRMRILQAVEVDEKVYVAIELIAPLYSTDAYFFEFGKDGKVLRWCKTGLTH